MRVSREEAEKILFERFHAAYKKRFGVELADVVHRDNPDFEVFDPVRAAKIGVEITGAFQDVREAIIQYSTYDQNPWYEASLDEIIRNINERLSDKTKKVEAYEYAGEIWLSIWVASFIYGYRSDMESVRARIVIPKNRFAEIWLIVRDAVDHGPDLFQLQGREA